MKIYTVKDLGDIFWCGDDGPDIPDYKLLINHIKTSSDSFDPQMFNFETNIFEHLAHPSRWKEFTY